LRVESSLLKNPIPPKHQLLKNIIFFKNIIFLKTSFS